MLSAYYGVAFDSIRSKTAKIKDRKAVCLNILNKRLLQSTNYNAIHLYKDEDVNRFVSIIRKELDIDELQAVEELRRRIEADKSFGTKKRRHRDGK